MGLVPDLGDGDPDDAFSTVPYEKGFNFIYYLESQVGGPAKFAPFIKDYVKRFGGTTLTTDDFKDFFLNYFKGAPGLKNIDWDAWLYSTGGRPVENKFDQSLLVAAETLKQNIVNGKAFSKEDLKGWKALQTM